MVVGFRPELEMPLILVSACRLHQIEAELEGLMSSGKMIDESACSNVISRMADDLVKGAFQ